MERGRQEVAEEIKYIGIGRHPRNFSGVDPSALQHFVIWLKRLRKYPARPEEFDGSLRKLR